MKSNILLKHGLVLLTLTIVRLPQETPFPLLHWDLAEWNRQGAAVGIQVVALQEPLYYFIKLNAILKVHYVKELRKYLLLVQVF